ncbi:MAG: polyamine aminopropyltransferase [Bdellovibrionales bacterium]|nr:polyamine aminopropyltransferase [Bdellovibrionales bacterium]
MSKNIVTETVSKDLSLQYTYKKKLYSKKSNFQKVEVVEGTYYGTMLFNDNVAMVSTRDEFVYHDMIAHVPLFLHPNPKKVLVIGGGDGGTAREVLRHSSVTLCDMVEIDEAVVEACKKYLPQTSSVLKNDKLNLYIEDGINFIKNCKQKKVLYDVILIDSTDPVGAASPLFNDDFYKNVYSCLSDNGIVVAQAESPFYYFDMQKKLCQIISNFFPITGVYNYANSTYYPGGAWSFILGSKTVHPIKDLDSCKIKNSNLKFDYYNAELHKASFALPEFQKQALSKFIKL